MLYRSYMEMAPLLTRFNPSLPNAGFGPRGVRRSMKVSCACKMAGRTVDTTGFDLASTRSCSAYCGAGSFNCAAFGSSLVIFIATRDRASPARRSARLQKPKPIDVSNCRATAGALARVLGPRHMGS